MTKFEEFKKFVSDASFVADIQKILGSETEKYLQIAINYIDERKDDPKTDILKAPLATVMQAIQKGAKSGLYIDGIEAYIAVRCGIAKFSPMYQGLLKLVRNSGEIDSINCDVVYANDQFDSWSDENGKHLLHRRDFKVKGRGPRAAVFAVVKTKGSQTSYIEIMEESEVLACKAANKSQGFSPWDGPFADEMWKKTILNRICKHLPKGTDISRVISDDAEDFANDDTEQSETTTTTTSETGKPSRLKSKIVAHTDTETVAAEPVTEPIQDAEVVEPEAETETAKTQKITGIVSNRAQQNVTMDGKSVVRTVAKVGEIVVSTFDESEAAFLVEGKTVAVEYSVKKSPKGIDYNHIEEIKTVILPI